MRFAKDQGSSQFLGIIGQCLKNVFLFNCPDHDYFVTISERNITKCYRCTRPVREFDTIIEYDKIDCTIQLSEKNLWQKIKK